jgi:hypothetical protein
MRQSRDPYDAPPTPRDRGGPVLRFAIVAALLGAAAWAFVTYAQGPTLTDSRQQEEQTLADAGDDGGYAATPAEVPQAAPPR